MLVGSACTKTAGARLGNAATEPGLAEVAGGAPDAASQRVGAPNRAPTPRRTLCGLPQFSASPPGLARPRPLPRRLLTSSALRILLIARKWGTACPAFPKPVCSRDDEAPCRRRR